MSIRVALATAAILAALPALAAQRGVIRDQATIACADRSDTRTAEELRVKRGINAATSFSVPRGCVSLLPEGTVTVVDYFPEAMSLVVPEGELNRYWAPPGAVKVR